jgi:hypothetical protein
MIKITIKTKQNINATNPPSKTNSLAIKTKMARRNKSTKRKQKRNRKQDFAATTIQINVSPQRFKKP